MYKNFIFFGASSELSLKLIDLIIKKNKNINIFIFSRKPKYLFNYLYLNKNININYFFWDSFDSSSKTLKKILQLNNCCTYIFNAIPQSKINYQNINEFYQINTFNIINLIDTLAGLKKSKIFFISSILSGSGLKRKEFYANSKNIVDSYILHKKSNSCSVLRLGPFKSSFSEGDFFRHNVSYISRLIYKNIYNNNRIIYVPRFYFFIVWLLKIFNK
jgi:short-subunit dehydrogenase